MKRQSHLIYCDTRTDLQHSQSSEGDVLYHSQNGVPIGWFFAFGGRNIWNPGDDVEARGGVVGRRNPYETQVEVAVVRLEQAEAALQSDAYLWPFLSAITLFRRKLMTKPKTGFVRVAAPWVIGLEEAQIDRWRAATAFAENCVNMVSAGRTNDGLRSLMELQSFSPFVPGGHSADLDELMRSPHFPGEEEVLRVALVAMGVPDNRDTFEKGARKEVAAALAKYRTLPPKAPPVPPPAPATAKGGILGKLGGLFGYKK
jgi:hypothetical protein